MKYLLLLITCFFAQNTFAQHDIKIDDIAQKQLRLMRKYSKADSSLRTRIFIDSLYKPYATFWNGYLGGANDVAGWLNESLSRLPEWETKHKTIDATAIRKQLKQVADSLKLLTGYSPKGKWYIVYGPAWTDLGGLKGGDMVIDLSHASNSSNERIKLMFPHEITHQIMSNVNKHHDTTAIAVIVGEGFAVWMNQYYWKEKQSLAENLGYTEEELAFSNQHLSALKSFLGKYKYSADANIIDVFRNRSQKLKAGLPGAIGYYLGYKIIDAYVQQYGPDSWKDVFTKPPAEIYEKSGF